MYFFNRIDAGRKLAAELKDYRYENSAVIALSDGGVLVGQEIAQALHCSISLLLTAEIHIPGGELAPVIGTVDQSGGFTYNNMFSTGQLEGFKAEFHNHIEHQKMEKMHEINRALGEGGILDRSFFKDRNVILVSDGLKTGTSIDAAVSYLKPIRTEKVIAAMPFVSVPAVDRLHLFTDEVHVLDVKANYFDTDHYYEDNYMPERDEIIAIINQIILKWA